MKRIVYPPGYALAFLALFAMPLLSQGQTTWGDILHNNQEKDLNEIHEDVEALYDGEDKGRGSGYKQYGRWVMENSLRTQTGGKLYNWAAKTFNEYNTWEAANEGEPVHGNWQQINMSSHVLTTGYNGGWGRVNCVEFEPGNPDHIYVGTPAGGLWHSTNGGASWSPLTDGISILGVSDIIIDHADPNHETLYILTGDGDGPRSFSTGVFKSTDGGLSWNSTDMTFDEHEFRRGYKMLMHPTNEDKMWVATNNGIYYTDEKFTDPPELKEAGTWFYDIELKPNNPSVLYGAGLGKFYRSTDGGDTWTQITNGLPTNHSGRWAVAVSPKDPDKVVVLVGEGITPGQYGGTYVSTNGGSSFTLKSNTPNILSYSTGGTGNVNQNQLNYDLSLAISPDDEDRIVTGAINVWESTDDAVNFTAISLWQQIVIGNYPTGPYQDKEYVHADIHELVFHDGKLWACSDGGLFRYDGSVNGWTDLSDGLEISEIYRFSTDPYDPYRILFATQDNGINLRDGNNLYHSWGGDGLDCLISHSNSDEAYAYNQLGGTLGNPTFDAYLYRSYDGGETIDPSDAVQFGPSEDAAWLTPIAMHPTNDNILLSCMKDVWRTQDAGDTWENISNGDTPLPHTPLGVSHIAIAPSDPNVVYVSKKDRLYRSTNAMASSASSVTWAQVPEAWPVGLTLGFGPVTVTYMAVDPDNANVVWVTVSGYEDGEKVYRLVYNSSTSTWNSSNRTLNLPNVPVHCVFIREDSDNEVYVGTDCGVFLWDDVNDDWLNFNMGMPRAIVKELNINPINHKIRAVTGGRGIWESDLFMGCSENLTINATHNGANNHEAEISITSTATFNPGATVNYRSYGHTRLVPGFHAKSTDAVFRAYNGPCGLLTFKNDVEPITGTYAGPLPGIITPDEVIEEGEDWSELRLYPNPTSGLTRLEFDVAQRSEVRIYLTDLMGRTVQPIAGTRSYEAGAYRVNIDGSTLPNGIYTVVVEQNNNLKRTQLVISH